MSLLLNSNAESASIFTRPSDQVGNALKLPVAQHEQLVHGVALKDEIQIKIRNIE